MVWRHLKYAQHKSRIEDSLMKLVTARPKQKAAAKPVKTAA
jgi:hypothetical protein